MYSHIALMLSLSFLNPTATTLTTFNNVDININNTNTSVVSIESGRITQTNMYIPTDSFKYYLDYALVENTNFQLEQEIARIQEEERIAEEKRQREEAERQARLEKERLAQQQRQRQEAARRQAERQRQAQRAASTPSVAVPTGNIPDRITYWANRYGIDAGRAIRIAQCESGLNPGARSPNGLYGGLYQQAFAYWPARATQAGLPGASVFDAEANIRVSMHMMATQGFHHWPVCSNR